MAHPSPGRRSIRLLDFDYRQAGWYFVTICQHGDDHLFGEVVDGDVHLSRAGRIVHSRIRRLAVHFQRLELDSFVVMPNHVHLIMGFADEPTVPEVDLVGIVNQSEQPKEDDSDASHRNAPNGTVPGSVGAVVQNLKSVTARLINRQRKMPGAPVWQRNYWERVVRNERELERFRRYIAENPFRWSEDELNWP